VNVPAPIAALVDDLETECGEGDPLLGWTEQTLAEYLCESGLDALDEPDLTAFMRRTIALWLWWAKGRVL
jgi:hypothetical protein